MSNTKKRPPIVAIMGHVDHGKTTLMDYIQKSNIAQKEIGGITQSIRAFEVTYKENDITFIDTPGHEAFSNMRERGSTIADIVLLVVAADDGVKPQTKEVIQLVQRDKIPMVVAINKIDLPGADVQRVKMELSQNGVLLEGWGGDTVAVEVSAKTGQGVDNLLDMILLVAELEELKPDESENRGIVLESYLQKNVGPESLVIVKAGSLHVGDFIAGAKMYGKIRAIIDDKNERVTEAKISQPVRILGLDEVLKSGETVVAGKDRQHVQSHMPKAETIAEAVEEEGAQELGVLESLDALLKKNKEEKAKPVLNVILKTDSIGSSEAITEALKKNTNPDVDIVIIKNATGEVTEADISYAKSARAVVIGFNVDVPARIRGLAAQEKVIVMTYSIIYELIDDVVTAAESLIPPELIEVFIGSADVVEVFTLSNGSHVAGSMVRDGKIVRGYTAQVMRGNEKVFEGKITSLRHFKDEVKEATKGVDCGIGFTPDFEVQKGDRIICIRIEKS